MVSIADVAKAAHVSKMTVSRVLNHPEQVSKEIINTVQTAINDLGYVQNRAGRALANQRHYTIAFLMLDHVETVDPYFGQLITEIADELQQAGYSLELHHQINDNFQAVDGILVSGAHKQDIQKLQSLAYPFVSYGSQSNATTVDVDNYQAIQKSTEFMAKQGYNQFIFLGLDSPDQFAKDRLAGFLAADVDHQSAHVYLLQNTDQAAQTLISQLAIPSNTGIIAASDRLALGALYACQNQVPDQIGIIGFDGIFIHQLSPLKLTTMRQPLIKIAHAMVASLLTTIENPTQPPANTRIMPELIEGETTRYSNQKH